MDKDKKSSMKIVKDYFFPPGTPAKEFLAEWKQLTPQDRIQLTEGISNGTLDY